MYGIICIIFFLFLGGCVNLGFVKVRNEVIYLNIVEFNKCIDIKIGILFIEIEIK